MIITKKFEMKITGAWQSYLVSESLTVDTSSREDLVELASIVGDITSFNTIRDAVAYACTLMVYNEVHHLNSTDVDFNTVWTARYAELQSSQLKNMNINNSLSPEVMQ